MPNNKEPQPIRKEPFLAVLNEASEIFIEEIPSRSGTRQFFVATRETSAESDEKAEKSQEELLENAAILLASREYLLARHIYSAVLKTNIKEKEALRGLGICLLRLGDPAAARKCFRALWDLFGEQTAAVWLAQCFSSERDDSMALEWYRKVKLPAVLPENDRFEFYKELGNCLFRLEQWVEAEQAYRHALEIQPKSDAIAANLGMLEIQRGHLELAASYFERALRHQPENAKAHAGMGVVSFQSQDFGLAARFFGKALDIDSQNLVALHQLLECGEHLDLGTEIEKRLERFLEKESQNHRIRFLLAVQFYKRKLWRQSEKELDQILSVEPSHISAKRLKEELNSHRG